MKYSLNLGQNFGNVDLKKIPHEKLATKAGVQLGGIDEVIDWALKYSGVLVVKIINVEDHPDADRLHICMVDDGGKAKGVKRDSKGLVQVVCGAPNVRAGMFVAWLPPGSTVPASYGDKEPFVLEARELRSVTSNGMLASAKELGIADDHDGILEIIPEEVGRTPKSGEPFVQFFGLDDFIMDFENKMFTHRPDCFGNLGISRELAGILGLAFKSPDWYINEPVFSTQDSEFGIKLQVKNDAGKLVPRFMAVAMSNVTVGSSPVWLQAVLSRVGMKSINNIVDVTNYVMHLTGQPLHAYDADKLRQVASSKEQVASLESRKSRKGDKLKLLNGKELTFEDDNDVLITSHDVPVGLAGVMGGSETEVDGTTKNIIIEAATFDMYTIRRTSMRHGLFTDASTRYTKGQSPLQNPRALSYAMKMIVELAGAEQSSNVYDIHGRLEEAASVTVNAQFINDRLGTRLSLKEITKLLENVEFKIVTAPADKTRLHVRPPFWRTDIELPEDVVEEVGRLHGYDNAPLVLPPRSAHAAAESPGLAHKMHLRYMLKECGANEVLTYSFVHGNLMTKAGQDYNKAFHVRNAISPDLQYFRLSVLPSLLEKVQGNIRADLIQGDDNEFALFEIGKTHIKGANNDEGVPEEVETLAFIFAADDKTTTRKYEGSPYYQASNYLKTLLPERAVFEVIDQDPKEETQRQMLAPFERSRTASVELDGKLLGFVGEITDEVKRALKLPNFTAGFEIEITQLKDAAKTTYQPISQYPKAQQDITFEVPTGARYSAVLATLQDGLGQETEQSGYNTAVLPRDIFQPEKSDKRRLTFRIWLSHPARTLTIDETNRALDTIAAYLKEKLSAERI